MNEALECICSINSGTLIHISADIGEAGEQQQHIKGNADPAVHGDDRRHGCTGIDQPFRAHDADLAQQVVDQTVDQEHIRTQQTGNGHGHHVTDQDHAADGTGQLKFLVKEQGKHETHSELDHQTGNGEDEGVLQNQPEGLILEQFHVILKSDKYGRTLLQVLNIRILQTQHNVVNQGVTHNHQDINQRRQNEEIRLALLALGNGKLFLTQDIISYLFFRS